MIANFRRSAAPLITTIQKLFSEDLAKENDFLRQENKILRSKLGRRVPLTDADRRTLVRYGLSIKERLGEVMTIVRPETLLAWNRRMKRQKWTFDNTPKRPGRPSKAKATVELALRMIEENAWGYVRIAGELKKLGHDMSPSCVRDLMRKHGFPPVPRRTGPSWKQFIQAHLDVMWAADFFTEEVWTHSGLVTYYALFFIQLSTRRVRFAGCTPQPDARWMQQRLATSHWWPSIQNSRPISSMTATVPSSHSMACCVPRGWRSSRPRRSHRCAMRMPRGSCENAGRHWTI